MGLFPPEYYECDEFLMDVTTVRIVKKITDTSFLIRHQGLVEEQDTYIEFSSKARRNFVFNEFVIKIRQIQIGGTGTGTNTNRV